MNDVLKNEIENELENFKCNLCDGRTIDEIKFRINRILAKHISYKQLHEAVTICDHNNNNSEDIINNRLNIDILFRENPFSEYDLECWTLHSD